MWDRFSGDTYVVVASWCAANPWVMAATDAWAAWAAMAPAGHSKSRRRKMYCAITGAFLSAAAFVVPAVEDM
eukprot:scaffold34593_cov179-Amphora_coffeaeformis.AAC.6